jgi:hypothetical protein
METGLGIYRLAATADIVGSGASCGASLHGGDEALPAHDDVRDVVELRFPDLTQDSPYGVERVLP